MALGPAALALPDNRSMITKLEADIDIWLHTNWCPGNGYPLPFWVRQAAHTEEYKAMLKRYLDAGWSNIIAEYRDGTNFLIFVR